MRTLHMSEVIQHIDQSVIKRKEQSDQLHTVWESLNNLAGVESFTGKTADAFKSNVISVQIPTVLSMYHSLDQWVEKANKFKEELLSFENENAIYTEEFITHDVPQSLQNVGDLAVAIINQINSEISSVSHLTSSSTISSSDFIYAKNEAILQIENNQSAFGELDTNHQKSFTDLKEEISHLKKLLSTIKGWQSEGKLFETAALKQIDKMIQKTDELAESVDKGLELAIKRGDESLPSVVAGFLDKAGKGLGAMSAAKGFGAIAVLLSRQIKLEKMPGTANYKVTVSERWKQGKDGKYTSSLAKKIKKYLDAKPEVPLAIKIHNRTTKGLNKTPGNVLKRLVGFKSNTNVLGIKKILEQNHKVLKFNTQLVKVEKNLDKTANKSKKSEKFKIQLDGKKTLDQFKSFDGVKTVLKKVPVVGTSISVAANAGEFFNDKNSNKTGIEKAGRFAAGIGADLGVAGLTSGGALIGSMIFPGVGTIIGGAIGAGIGIAGSIAFEDNIKDFGEKALSGTLDSLKNLESKGAEVGKSIKDGVSSLGENTGKVASFIGGIFK